MCVVAAAEGTTPRLRLMLNGSTHRWTSRPARRAAGPAVGATFLVGMASRHRIYRVALELAGRPPLPGANVARLCSTHQCVQPLPLGRVGGEPTNPALETDIQAALPRGEVNVQDSFTRAGVSPSCYRDWVFGGQVPFYDTLEAVADSLDAPELLAHPYRRRVIVMMCRRCEKSKDYLPSIVRTGAKNTEAKDGQGFAGAEIDYEAGTGVYLCHACTTGDIGRAQIRKMTRGGKRENILKASGKALNAKYKKRYTKKERDARWQGVIEGNRGRKQTPETKRRVWIASVPITPKGNLWRCRVCKFFGYTYKSDALHGRMVHPVPCLAEWRLEHEGFPPELPGPTLEQVKPGEDVSLIERDWALTVFHIVKNGKIGGKGGRGLAAALKLERVSANNAIKTTINRFPPDDRGGPQLTGWCERIIENKRIRERQRLT